jgi:hypothetical protein
MKRTYSAPAIALSGDVVIETKSSGAPPEFGATGGVLQAPGSVGFQL